MLRDMEYLLKAIEWFIFLSCSHLRLQSKERMMLLFLFLDGRILFPQENRYLEGSFSFGCLSNIFLACILHDDVSLETATYSHLQPN